MAENARRGTLLEAALEKPSRARVECAVTKALREHPDRADEICELIEATPSRVQYSVAAATLKDAEIVVPASTISRHQRRICACHS